MATGMHMDKRNVDCLVLGHHDQDRIVSAKSVTMRAMTLCKNLSGYRELLLSHIQRPVSNYHLCQLFTIKVYTPTVQFAEVPNKSSISNNCCVFAIMFI